MKKTISAGFAALLLFSACQKDDNVTPDPQQVSATILSPQAGQIFHSGDTVLIRARVSYPSELHGYEIKLSDSATDSVIYDIAQHTHADSFDISEVWVAGTSQARTVNLSLITIIDHDGATARKDVAFKLLP